MTKKAEHMKYKEGAKRSFRPNEWYIDKRKEREANSFLAGSKGGVPNNPANIRSFDPIPAPVDPAGSMQGDQVLRRNPYGDGEQIINSEKATWKRPNQRGASFDPPPVPVEKVGKVKKANDQNSKKGMSTSIGLMNTGPLRDVSHF
tara:strand:- start:5219 stop:5656 length:438 start_codon:yes stop_codon:yes gene_type:complete